MTPTLVGRLLAPAASLAVLAAQPAVLCGLACLAAHSPAHSLAHRHHGAAEAPCGGGVTAAHDDATAGLQPVGSALPAVVSLELTAGERERPRPIDLASAVPLSSSDPLDPPPRA